MHFVQTKPTESRTYGGGVNIFVPTSFDPTFLQIETKREKKKKIGTSLSLLSAILDETREIKGEKISTNCIK